ncbi:RNA polymerase sigma-70 factor (ECF subfamily) [Hydrogenophaga palleronii]|uniref:RNA polymerase sigma-70 factor (ECF subfamily) n=1 Tax=Hydrogenophaga palleronii TaxID=65655 RepID=A0ABU1WQB2_9BURK|nr:sigma-70 family RNA polymerase sigma factor [Hydrogenophaga palleronii]MDR7151481.1 RNA polymerase sigma-70 factor (ECF subfamily) [Hydrogenophaga palleronii]
MNETRELLILINADHRQLVRAATRLLGSAEAEDAVQDAYVRALEAQALQLTTAQAWLLTVVRNLAIDRLRRRKWLLQWTADSNASEPLPTFPSAEIQAALAEETIHALRLLAAHLSPAEGAAVLLHEVFEAGHAEIAQASGKAEAASRQQLRRALMRVRQARDASRLHPNPELDPGEETLFRLYLQSLHLRDPQALWAMLRHPPISAVAEVPRAASEVAAVRPATTCGVVQVGGQLQLVLTLDGVTLCVLPLGARTERDRETAAF